MAELLERIQSLPDDTRFYLAGNLVVGTGNGTETLHGSAIEEHEGRPGLPGKGLLVRFLSVWHREIPAVVWGSLEARRPDGTVTELGA